MWDVGCGMWDVGCGCGMWDVDMGCGMCVTDSHCLAAFLLWAGHFMAAAATLIFSFVLHFLAFSLDPAIPLVDISSLFFLLSFSSLFSPSSLFSSVAREHIHFVSFGPFIPRGLLLPTTAAHQTRQTYTNAKHMNIQCKHGHIATQHTSHRKSTRWSNYS